ncbi:MAG: type VII secretion-associated serine protease mycosin, partial [Actinobacteria bacterium]|nr:type VII secretion-associated serine protease mycosin [Actinomycetota bacterium]
MLMKGAVQRCAQRAAVLVLLSAVLLLAAMPGVAQAQGIPQQVRSDDMTTLNAIDVPAAWAKTKGAGVTVAVLDTGANGSVPDLTGSVVAGPDYTVGADPAGFNPPHEHGTYICSIIAGHGSGPGR